MNAPPLKAMAEVQKQMSSFDAELKDAKQDAEGIQQVTLIAYLCGLLQTGFMTVGIFSCTKVGTYEYFKRRFLRLTTMLGCIWRS